MVGRVSAAEMTLCGVSETSTAGLYFAVAVRPDASIAKADDAETVIQTQAPPTLWIFVARPVDAVLCVEGNPPRVQSRCAGAQDICADVIRRLTDDPRARP